MGSAAFNAKLHPPTPVASTRIDHARFTVERTELPRSAKCEFHLEDGPAYLALYDVLLESGETNLRGVAHAQPRDLRGAISYLPAGVELKGHRIHADRLNSYTAIYFSESFFEALPASLRAPDPRLSFHDARLETTLKKIDGLFKSTVLVEPILIETLVTLAAIELAKGAKPSPDVRFDRISGAQIRRVNEYIEANLGKPISLAELAGVARLSEFYFSRAFKQATGLSPYRFLLTRRVDRAKSLIRAGGLSLTDIAALTGFSGSSQFSRTFTAIAGETARQFRRRCGPAAPDDAED